MEWNSPENPGERKNPITITDDWIIRGKMKRLERPDYLNWLVSHKDEQIIKVLTGVRRCGKSTIFEIYRVAISFFSTKYSM